MARRSRLHVPQPHSRPGEEPDFSYLQTSPAGAVARPDVNARVRDIGNLAVDLVRVLDDEHERRRPVESAPRGRRTCRSACATCCSRASSTTACSARSARERSPSICARYGEEAVAVAQAWRCSPATCCFPSYRQQGIYMVRGRPLVDLMCQLLSNTRDMCKGRQLPVMYHWNAGPHLLDLRQPNDPVPAGGGLGDGRGDQATKTTSPPPGSARARAPRPTSTTRMLFAAVYQAPVIINIVNNQWAISTFQGFAGGEQRSFAARGPGYGMRRHPRRRQRFPRGVRGHAVGRRSARAPARARR